MSVGIVAAGSWTTAVEPGDAGAAAWAAGTLARHGFEAQALALATLDSGARESVGFWRDAQGTGLAFANPRAFPWTLANSPAGRVAQELGIRGPTYTLVGRANALVAALDHAYELVVSGDVERALVAALDGVDGAMLLSALTLTLAGDGDDSALGLLENAPPAFGDDALTAATASELLALVLRRLGEGRDALVGADGDACFRFAAAVRR